MNTENNTQKFVCECGKSFDTQVKLSHHKTRCKVFQTNKKQKEFEERETRRLPNCVFLHKNELTKEKIFEILEEQQGRGCNPAVY